ncbi:hypothetical protein [Actinokineospora sp.]|uniref:hypothetical protein n=1 Tax=Actinokineospora sp. TaxID=1872133 RepID=UPI0040376587
MSMLVRHANEVSPLVFGPLEETADAKSLSGMTPVMATPAAVAAGVAISAAAFGAGFALGYGYCGSVRPKLSPQ